MGISISGFDAVQTELTAKVQANTNANTRYNAHKTLLNRVKTACDALGYTDVDYTDIVFAAEILGTPIGVYDNGTWTEHQPGLSDASLLAVPTTEMPGATGVVNP